MNKYAPYHDKEQYKARLNRNEAPLDLNLNIFLNHLINFYRLVLHFDNLDYFYHKVLQLSQISNKFNIVFPLSEPQLDL